MKKIGILFAAIAAMVAGNTASANNLGAEIIQAHLQAAVAVEMAAKNVINWPVGERAVYDIKAAFGNLGMMTKWTDREEGNAVWVIAEVTGQMQQKQEILMDRATGQCMKMISNGSEAACPGAGDMEIISQDEQSVTVPAGTFDTIHITLKVNNQPQVKQIEVWMNPRDIVMEGLAKTKLETSFMPVDIDLKSMTRP